MKFRTEYLTGPDDQLLDPEQTAVLLGSCFTDNIGRKMRFCRWRAFPNICGSLFNPASIARILRLACEPEEKKVSDAVRESIAGNGPLFVSWLTDSSTMSLGERDTRLMTVERIAKLRTRLGEARTLIITFGTAWIYELRERPGYVVSNCHKFPAETFLRRRMTVPEIVGEWESLLRMLDDKYPGLRVIFTVSPVRHLKDGFEGNSRSKAILQLACEELCVRNPQADYFPAYEIMNDDLRDYRFYASDLVHPSEEAVEYIWEKFQDRYLSKSARDLLEEGAKVTRRLEHRPRIFGSEELSGCIELKARQDALKPYDAFIAKHPGMLRLED